MSRRLGNPGNRKGTSSNGTLVGVAAAALIGAAAVVSFVGGRAITHLHWVGVLAAIIALAKIAPIFTRRR